MRLISHVKAIASNLLPLGGDTVHMVNTASELMSKPFNFWIESMLTALRKEFQFNHVGASAFLEICKYHSGLSQTDV